MHPFARKGLLLSAATGTLVVGYAGTASADSGGAVALGAADDSPGTVSGNVAQLPTDVPIDLCGDVVSVLGYGSSAEDNHCLTGGPEMAPHPMPCTGPVLCPPPVPCPPPPPGPCLPDSGSWAPQSGDGSWTPAPDPDQAPPLFLELPAVPAA